MDRNSKARISNLLKYTYRVNMVFFAGFAAYYVMKRVQKEETQQTNAERDADNRDQPT
ncbi:hypothetical protein DM02DRAFT_614416 [Periconia macrospinosa]|uniref:Uncharacterized protein n=1 Tax=Periconia macrospinosa TaxID=97972 RepID=A0A2V1DPX0_9PLEO|nr:hypothetical protein DM02DRAFT_614416 [Periconia macrospinosa]